MASESKPFTSCNRRDVLHILINQLRVARVELHLCRQSECGSQFILDRFPQSVYLVPGVRLQTSSDHGHVAPPKELQSLHQDLGASFERRHDFDVGVVDLVVVHFGGLAHESEHWDVPRRSEKTSNLQQKHQGL